MSGQGPVTASSTISKHESFQKHAVVVHMARTDIAIIFSLSAVRQRAFRSQAEPLGFPDTNNYNS